MLNRVRDFRYEDIKNWKPLVSLRESYRKETGVRNLALVGICILAVLLGYSVINGSIRFTGIPTAAKSGQAADGDRSSSQSALGASERVVEESRTRIPQERNPVASTETNRNSSESISSFPERSSVNTASRIPIVGNTGPTANSTQLVKYQQETGHNPALATGPRLKIAVCDIQRIVARDLAALTDRWITEAEAELRDHQSRVRNGAAQISDADLFILEAMFEQKKQLASAQIREMVRQYRDEVIAQLRPIADRIAIEQNYDFVLSTDQVLSFVETYDITGQVHQAWLQQRQMQQTVRGNDPNRR